MNRHRKNSNQSLLIIEVPKDHLDSIYNVKQNQLNNIESQYKNYDENILHPKMINTFKYIH